MTFTFRPLWKLSDVEKASIWAQDIAGIVAAYQSGILPPDVALREIRELSDISGRGSNVTDDDIAEAQNAPPTSEDPEGEVPGLTDRTANIDDYRKQGAAGESNGVVGI
jgi:hypothetical protein